jgi:hypothetical protein
MKLFDNPGVPTDEEWGTYCPHGVKIVEKDPNRTDPEGYPIGRIVEPWPCDRPGCTREQFEKEMREEAESYEAERWAEYRAMQ